MSFFDFILLRNVPMKNWMRLLLQFALLVVVYVVSYHFIRKWW